MRYSRRTSNYLKSIALSNSTHMTSMTDPIAIIVETPRITSWWSLEKELTKLICMNHRMVLYLTINQVDSCHSFVRSPLT